VALALNKASVPTFMLDGYRPRELGSTPDKEAIAVRVGHHCPSILRRCRLESAVRASLALDNTHDEVDLLVPCCAGLPRRMATSLTRTKDERPSSETERLNPI